jgi:hypothetical protein
MDMQRYEVTSVHYYENTNVTQRKLDSCELTDQTDT